MNDPDIPSCDGSLLVGVTGMAAAGALPMCVGALRSVFAGSITTLMTHDGEDPLPAEPLFVDRTAVPLRRRPLVASEDSRYHRDDSHGGTVPVSDVVGRAVVVAWPISRSDFLSVPDTFK
jgi:hypothetical protein